MPLTHIEYGSLASSEVMNDNFEYLDDRISTVAGNLTSSTSSIYSSIAGMNSTFSEDISDIQSDLSDLETDVTEVRSDFYSGYYTPNYSNAISVSYSSGDAVGFNGWLIAYFANQRANTEIAIKINGVPIGAIRTGSDGGAVDASACMAMVSATDIVSWTGTFSGNPNFLRFYKVPFTGGQ